MKNNLPTNWLILLSMETRWKYVCYHSFLLWFIKVFVWHPGLFVFSICIYTVIALLNNCPMHGEFLSDAWLKMNAGDQNHFQRWNKRILDKIFENYDYWIFYEYIVTEIKLFKGNLVLKGMSFIIYNLINFGWYFSKWCEILGLRHFKVIPAKVLSP